jgi:lipopolysaccharide biosynthesis regulator YciM
MLCGAANQAVIDFQLHWLLISLPIAFALGWLASRLDLKQWQRELRTSPKTYYTGLNFLLNEQQDKAIDAFIDAMQHDPETTELHFALGNLFRRRGEFERAVRVHEHLIARGDLSSSDHVRAQYALAQDFTKAGLFDLAEQAHLQLMGSSYEIESCRALLALYERSRDWAAAISMAEKLETLGIGSYTGQVAHYRCEIASMLLKSDTDAALKQLQLAQAIAPQSPRAYVMLGQLWALYAHPIRPDQALKVWGDLLNLPTAPLDLIADDIAQLALKHSEVYSSALELLQAAYELRPSLDILQALSTLEPSQKPARLQQHLHQHPSLSAAAAVLQLPSEHLDASLVSELQTAVERSSQPLHRYRCAACGFEAQRYFWQCPGCLNWDAYPPQRMDEL